MGDLPERIWCRRDWQGKWHEGDWTDIEPGGAEYSEYLRADIAAAREAELRAEVERLKEERDEARSRFNDIDLCHMAVAPCQTLISAHDEADRLRGLLDEARKGVAAIESYLAKGHDKMAHNIARATLAKIGGQ